MKPTKSGDPVQAASKQSKQSHYNTALDAELAALGMRMPQEQALYTVIECTAINGSEPVGQVYITHYGASILDYARQRVIEISV